MSVTAQLAAALDSATARAVSVAPGVLSAAAGLVSALLLVIAVPALASAADDTRLADAAMKGDRAAVRALLGEKVDVNALGRDGTPALHWAVRTDDLETTRLLLSSGASAKLANRLGLTPLAIAATNGSTAMLRVLLDAGADPNSADPTGETTLMTAAKVGVIDAVQLLLERGAIVDAREEGFQQTALMFAVREDHPDVIRLLVSKGAQVNAKTRVGATPGWVLPNSVPGFGHGIGIVRGGLPARGSRAPIPGGLSPLQYAARDGHVDAAKILLDSGADINQVDANAITPLITAIVNNRVEMARLLIDRGANIAAADWYGRTPLWAAVETRNMDIDNASFENSIDRAPLLEIITVLLAKGADPNVRLKEVPPIRRSFLRVTGDLSWVDMTGQTPFLRAALAGDVTVMRLLLQHKADPKIGTFAGTSPLMIAAGVNWVFSQTYDEGQAARLEAVKLCAELGMDVNQANDMGITALMGAANNGSDDIIKFLVEKGARVDPTDKEGRSALTWAEGVFLATHPARPKATSIALLKDLMTKAGVSQ
jgi:ankyrin repeat protein